MNKNNLIIISFLIVFILVSIIILNPFNIQNNPNETVLFDADDDGTPDDFDDFPDDPNETKDSDVDGIGDNEDDFPFDPDEWKDTDGDKVGDNSDEYPNDPNEWRDTDEDGIGDNSDINPYVNLSVTLSIDKIKLIKKVDLFKWGQIYLDVSVGPVSETFDNNGKRWFVQLNKEQTINKQLTYDIPDDTDEKFTEIEIVVYDYDLIREVLGEKQIVDINEDSSENSIKINFDNTLNQIVYKNPSEGNDAIIWFEITSPNPIEPDEQVYDIEYKWTYKNKLWKLEIQIPVETYKNYVDSTINRIPQKSINIKEAMSKFVTYDEKIIIDLADKLLEFANTEGYTEIETANFILRFTQEIIEYELDFDTQGCDEYWRFPVESLVDQQGDCEDSSVLYSSIMESLGYDTALLFYTWDNPEGERIGHLSVGLNIDEASGTFVTDDDGAKYYYCETTTKGYTVGKLPPDLREKSIKEIIKIE